MKNYIWNKTIKWIKGYEGRYAITTDGKVASYPKNRRKPFWLKLVLLDGYLRISFHLKKDQKWRWFYIHLLVLETFVGLRPKGMQGCHNDGNPLNNNLDNLRWDTPLNNILDRDRSNFSSVWFGVSFSRQMKKWRMRKDLYFDSEVEAAIAYNKFVKFFNIPYARLNTVG